MKSKPKNNSGYLTELRELQKRIAKLEAFENEWRKTEQALKKSEDKFAKAFHTNSALMAITTISEGRFIEVNNRFLKTMGYRKGEVIGKTSKQLNIFVDRRQRQKVIDEMKEKGYARDKDVLVRRKNGDILWGLFCAETIHLENEPCLLTTMNDITDRKKAESERDKTIADLQKALVEIKTLRGIIPICAYCKKIRDDKGFWHQVESYISEHSEAEFTHWYCPECQKNVLEEIKRLRKQKP